MSEYLNLTNIIDTNEEIQSIVNSFGENKYEIVLKTLQWLKINMSKYIFESNEDRMKLWRNRKASEIFSTKKSTGCTDMGILFCSIMRTAGISCSYIETVKHETLEEIKNMSKQDSINFQGHVFCRVNIGELELIIDPTDEQLFIRRQLPQISFINTVIFAEGSDYEELGLKDIDSQINLIKNSDLIK